MDLATYLQKACERPSHFGRRIGAKPSTISGWLNDPARGPSRAMLAKIEAATNGQVTAKDFAPSEECTKAQGAGRHVEASGFHATQDHSPSGADATRNAASPHADEGQAA